MYFIQGSVGFMLGNFGLKGTHTVSNKIELIPEPKCDNTEPSILQLKPWNSIFNTRYRTPNFSGGAPYSAPCACGYNQEKRCSFY